MAKNRGCQEGEQTHLGIDLEVSGGSKERETAGTCEGPERADVVRGTRAAELGEGRDPHTGGDSATGDQASGPACARDPGAPGEEPGRSRAVGLPAPVRGSGERPLVDAWFNGVLTPEDRQDLLLAKVLALEGRVNDLEVELARQVAPRVASVRRIQDLEHMVRQLEMRVRSGGGQ